MNDEKPKTMKEANKITGEMIDNILCTAFEGGINYWCGEVRIKCKAAGAKFASETVSRGGLLLLQETDDGDASKWHALTRAKITRGILCAAIHRGQTVQAFYDNYDAEGADCAVQFAIFDELIYG